MPARPHFSGLIGYLTISRVLESFFFSVFYSLVATDFFSSLFFSLRHSLTALTHSLTLTPLMYSSLCSSLSTLKTSRTWVIAAVTRVAVAVAVVVTQWGKVTCMAATVTVIVREWVSERVAVTVSLRSTTALILPPNRAGAVRRTYHCSCDCSRRLRVEDRRQRPDTYSASWGSRRKVRVSEQWVSNEWAMSEQWVSEQWVSEWAMSEQWVSEQWVSEWAMSEQWVSNEWAMSEWAMSEWVSNEWVSEQWVSEWAMSEWV
jgi:hypothetical protein